MMHPNRATLKTVLATLLAALGATVAEQNAFGIPPRSQELETLNLSKNLQPVPDDVWAQIAGPKVSENYTILKGDTLYDISMRLFGDGKYWPKIWALNNARITNPHLIRPGNLVAFEPGTGSSLPTVSIRAAQENLILVDESTPGHVPAAKQETSGEKTYPRSNEWSMLPKQRWESVTIRVPPTVDAQGFDKRTRISRNTSRGNQINQFASGEKLESRGTIRHSRYEQEYLTLNDRVFIESEKGLQVGDVYAIVSQPTKFSAPSSDRTGYRYSILGEVKIVGVKEGLFEGLIINARGLITRGNILIPKVERLGQLQAIPGSQKTDAVIVVDTTDSTDLIGQYKTVFIDKGTKDGIAVGMIFRSYRKKDPKTDKKITDSNHIPLADIQVTHVTDTYSTGLVISSIETFDQDTFATLLTDLSSLDKRSRNNGGGDDLSSLENLDGGGDLGTQESQTLEELEGFGEVGKSEVSDSKADDSDLDSFDTSNLDASPVEDPLFPESSAPFEDASIPEGDATLEEADAGFGTGLDESAAIPETAPADDDGFNDFLEDPPFETAPPPVAEAPEPLEL